MSFNTAAASEAAARQHSTRVSIVELELLSVIRTVRVEPKFEHSAGLETARGDFSQGAPPSRISMTVRSGQFRLELLGESSSIRASRRVVHRFSHVIDRNFSGFG